MEKAQISSLLNTLLPQTLVDFLSHTPKKGGGGQTQTYAQTEGEEEISE